MNILKFAVTNSAGRIINIYDTKFEAETNLQEGDKIKTYKRVKFTK